MDMKASCRVDHETEIGFQYKGGDRIGQVKNENRSQIPLESRKGNKRVKQKRVPEEEAGRDRRCWRPVGAATSLRGHGSHSTFGAKKGYPG
jgi:hypothetical protein